MGESLADAAMLYRNIPIEYVTAAANAARSSCAAAAAGEEAAKLDAVFAELTGACNACHTAAEVPFIEIKTPSASPFSNQNFAPGEN